MQAALRDLAESKVVEAHMLCHPSEETTPAVRPREVHTAHIKLGHGVLVKVQEVTKALLTGVDLMHADISQPVACKDGCSNLEIAPVLSFEEGTWEPEGDALERSG